MKYPVDETLKSLCDDIASMALSKEEWLQRGKKNYHRGAWECVYLPFSGGYFLFSIRGIRDYTYDTEQIPLDDVVKIHEGHVNEIEIHPRSGRHPEDVGMRRVEVDLEVLFNAINYGINTYVNEVLIPKGIVNKEVYHNTPGLSPLKHEIAMRCAQDWKVSWVNDEEKRKR
jgi:hypothetical protein